MAPCQYLNLAFKYCHALESNPGLQNYKTSMQPTQQLSQLETKVDTEQIPKWRLTWRLFGLIISISCVFGGFVVIYKSVDDVVDAYGHNVRSVSFVKVNRYKPPGIIIYPTNNTFVACGHYFNNIVGSKVRLSELDLQRKQCTYEHVTYNDPLDHVTLREAIVFRGPRKVKNVEALFVHFQGTNQGRDFVTVSYFVISFWSHFKKSQDHSQYLHDLHGTVPTFAISAGLRTWVKLSLREVYFIGIDQPARNFLIEASIVKYVGTNSTGPVRNFFIFFEWKNNLIERSRELRGMTPWSVAGSMCGLILAMYKASKSAHKMLRARLKDVKTDINCIQEAKRLRETNGKDCRVFCVVGSNTL